jgi:uracil-DNA glycosylase
MTILFVGSNPSNASTCDIAFHGSTKSSKILTEWTKDIQGTKMHVNVLNQKTKNNRPLTASEVKVALPRLAIDLAGVDKIVALGKTAAKALSQLGVSFYEMPHPSPRNRLLNDPAYTTEKVKGLISYCSSGCYPSATKVED